MTQRMELLPGVWLNSVKSERFKTGCFSINFLQPLQEETAATNALIPSVLLRGCEAHPNMTAISSCLDRMYGASAGALVRKKGEVQTVGLYADFLEDCFAAEPLFARVMELIEQLLFDSCLEDGGFLEEYVSGERQNLSNAIASRLNDKRAYAVSKLLKNMCPGEAYAVPRLGTTQSLTPVDGKNLRRRYLQMLADSPIEIFYLGRQDAEVVAKTVLNMLSSLPKGVRKPLFTQTAWETHPVRYVQESLDVTQGKLAMGLRTDITAKDASYPALMVLNTVFGSGMSSKLFLQIREAQSLCYYASSSIDKYKGIMLVDAGIEFDKYQVARDGILHQLDLCRQGHVTIYELESAKRYLLSSLRAAQDSPGRMDDFAVGQACGGLTGTMEELFQTISRVTLADAVDAANTLTLDTVYFLKGVEK